MFLLDTLGPVAREPRNSAVSLLTRKNSLRPMGQLLLPDGRVDVVHHEQVQSQTQWNLATGTKLPAAEHRAHAKTKLT